MVVRPPLSTDNNKLYICTIFGYLFVKKVILLSFLIASATAGGWFYQGNDDVPCIEDWFAQTQSFFNNAVSSIEKMPTPNNEQLKIDQLDEKLQALLPNENMDLSYSAAPISEQTIVNSADGELLPNLFKNTTDKSTSLSGQVHMDEDDKIIGAEVQVSIPTNL